MYDYVAIQQEIIRGEMSFNEIAETYGVDIADVDAVLEQMMVNEIEAEQAMDEQLENLDLYYSFDDAPF